MEEYGKADFDDVVKKHFKMVYVPNWFSVDLKTGVSFSDLGGILREFVYPRFITRRRYHPMRQLQCSTYGQ